MSEKDKVNAVPSNPKDRERLQGIIKELSTSMLRIESEREYQKEAVSEISDDLQIPKKTIKQMAKDYHNNQFDQNVDEFEEYRHLYETVMEK